jgi:hypothetical protein
LISSALGLAAVGDEPDWAFAAPSISESELTKSITRRFVIGFYRQLIGHPILGRRVSGSNWGKY